MLEGHLWVALLAFEGAFVAISWGSWNNNTSGNGMRVGIEFSQSPSSVGSGTSSVTVTARIYVETKASVSDSTNALSWSGAFGSGSTSVNINHGGSGGTTLMRTVTRNVSTSYSGTVSSSLSASLTGINAIPGSASVSDSHTTARRPYSAPKAPSNVRSTRSGTSITTSWTRNPTAAQPYDEIRFEQQTNNGSWSVVGTWSGASTTHTMTGRNPNSSYRYRVRAQNSAGNSGWAYGATITIPPNAPNPPSNANVTRTSDARQVVTWSRGSSTSTAPITQQDIQRWDIARGSFITIATVNGTVTSYTDSTTASNQQYRYRVRSKNSAGTSGWANTPYISTTPAAPTNVAAKKQGTDIVLSWSLGNVRKSDAVEVWLTSGGVDGTSRHVLLTGRPTSWTHADPDNTKTWQYRVKTREEATGSETGPTLYSAFSSRSNTVQLLAPPSAPSMLAPSASAIDAADENIFTWSHNAVDTTDQTGYELRYRVDGGAWVTILDRASGFSRRTFPEGTFENGTGLEWQVRTWGEFATASPWSDLAVVSVSARPSATIIFPDGAVGTPVVLSSALDVEWEYFDPEFTTQTSVRLRLDDENGAQVWASTLQMASTSYSIPYVLADGASYTVSVSVRDAAGLWSYETSQVFDVEYAKPAAPIIDATWDLDLGGVVISIEHPEPGEGEAEAVSADLQHSADGEDWTTIAAGLEPTTSTVDFIPVLDTVNYYRVISCSALPSSAQSAPVPVFTPSQGWVFVNGGADWSVICRIRRNVHTSHTPHRAKVLHGFAGREYPIEVAGNQRGREISISGYLGAGASTNKEWMDMYDMPAPLIYREPADPDAGEPGTREHVSFTGYTVDRETIIYTVNMSFSKVEGV